LKLPSVATWWCGARAGLDHVLAHLPDLVIRPAFPHTGFEPVVGAALGREQRLALAERLRSRPRDFVGQERLALSTAPALVGDRPSRAADNLFWLGRYVERADGMVRLLRGILARLTEKSGLADAPELPVLLRALGETGAPLPVFRDQGAPGLTAPEGELLALI